MMALLVCLKLVATATCYASGNAGGIFGPSLFIGAMLGGAVGGVAHMLLPDYTGSVGAYALVGMGAAFAGIIRVPLTSVIMIFEVTRDYTIIVPLMIANLIGYYISSRLQEEPIYEALLHQDGSIYWVLATIVPILDEHKRPNQYVSIRTDITQRKEAEEALKESDRRFRDLLGNVELIAMTLDRRGMVTFCNDYLLRLTGRKRQEVIGRDWFADFIPDADTETEAIFRANIDAGMIPLHHHNPIKVQGGAVREIAWNNTMLRDPAGNIIGTASIGEDVTERNQAVEALRQSEERFRQVVENIHEVFWMSDVDKRRMIYISPGYEAIWARSCESLYAAPNSWNEHIHPADRERVLKASHSKQIRGNTMRPTASFGRTALYAGSGTGPIPFRTLRGP